MYSFPNCNLLQKIAIKYCSQIAIPVITRVKIDFPNSSQIKTFFNGTP